MAKGIGEQRDEMQRLRDEMAAANQRLEQSQSRSVDSLSDLVDEGEKLSDTRRTKDLMQRIQKLFEANVRQQELRVGVIAQIPAQLTSAGQSRSAAGVSSANGSEQLAERSRNLGDGLIRSRDTMKTTHPERFCGK